jgi:hypothetical protein
MLRHAVPMMSVSTGKKSVQKRSRQQNGGLTLENIRQMDADHATADTSESDDNGDDDEIMALHFRPKKRAAIFDHDDDDDSSSVDTIDLTQPIFDIPKRKVVSCRVQKEAENNKKNDPKNHSHASTLATANDASSSMSEGDSSRQISRTSYASKNHARFASPVSPCLGNRNSTSSITDQLQNEEKDEEFVLPDNFSDESSDDDQAQDDYPIHTHQTTANCKTSNQSHSLPNQPSSLFSKQSIVNPYANRHNSIIHEEASDYQIGTTKLSPVPYAYYTQQRQHQPPPKSRAITSTLSSCLNHVASTKCDTTTIMLDFNDSDMERLGGAAFGFDTDHDDTMKPASLRNSSHTGISENNDVVDLCNDGTRNPSDEEDSYHPWDYDESMVVRMGMHRDSQSPYRPPQKSSRTTATYDEEIETFSDDDDGVDYKRSTFGRVASSYIERRRSGGSLEHFKISSSSQYTSIRNDLPTRTERNTTQPRRIRDYRSSNPFFAPAVVTRSSIVNQNPPYLTNATETTFAGVNTSSENIATNISTSVAQRNHDTTDWNAELAAVRAFGSLHRNDITGGSGVGAGSYQITHIQDHLHDDDNSRKNNSNIVNNKENNNNSSRWNQSFVSQPSRQQRCSNTNAATKKKRGWGRKRGSGRGRGSSRSSSNRRAAPGRGSGRNQNASSSSSWAGNADDPNLQHIGGAEMSF